MVRKKGTCFLRVMDQSGSIISHYTAETFRPEILKQARLLVRTIDGSYIHYTKAGFQAMKAISDLPSNPSDAKQG